MVRTPMRGWMPVCALVLSLLLPLAAYAEPSKAPYVVNVQTCNVAQCALLPGIGMAKGAAIETTCATKQTAPYGAIENGDGSIEGGEVKVYLRRQHTTESGEDVYTGTVKLDGKDGAQ